MTLVKELVRREQHIPMTYEEFLTTLDESVHAEWVDGEAIIFMPPIPRHQDVVHFVATLLRMFAEWRNLGSVLIAPLEMKLQPHGNVREPDILFVANEHLDRISDKRLEGPADLVIEVISTESVKRDRDDKFYEYQDAGIREYWVLDARPNRVRADFYILDSHGRYRAMPVNEDDIYYSTLLPGFWFDVSWLFQDQLPNILPTFAQIIGHEQLIAALPEPGQS